MITQVRLEEVCSLITDGSHNPPKAIEQSDFIMLSSRNINNGFLNFEGVRYLSEDDFYKENKRTDVKPGDVLMTIVGTLGRVLVVTPLHPKFTLQRSVCVLKPDSNLIESGYLSFALKSEKFQRKLTEGAKGVAQKGIYLKDIRNLKIPLPPLEEQKKIAAILDAADDYRQKTKALIDKYDQLIQSLFLDMFGDPITNPKGWEKVTLESCLKKVQKIGKSFSEEAIQYVDIASVDNVSNIIKETTEFRTDERPSRAQQILLSNDVIYSTVRPNLKNIAINHVDGRIGSTGFFVCRTSKDLLNSSFLFHVLLSDSTTDYFVGITSGANYPAVKSTDMRKFLIIKPPIELQNQFAERVVQIEKQKQQAEASLIKAEELFNSLLQKAFKAELTN